MRPIHHRVNDVEASEDGLPRSTPRPLRDLASRRDALAREPFPAASHPREHRLRDAGLSGARALTRLLVALIEHLGIHDRMGGNADRGWPHGASLTAFGPSPVGVPAHPVMAG